MAKWITVPDPRDRFGVPLFEGLESDAYKKLEPGLYDAVQFETGDIGQVDILAGASLWLDPAPREF